MTIAEKFQAAIIEKLKTILEGQEDQIQKAGELIANTVKNNGVVQSFGSGHSYGML